jgi:hypothetical protein
MSIKLKKMTDFDYQAYPGCETDQEYFPHAFINWAVPFKNTPDATCIVIMDTQGLQVDIHGEDVDTISYAIGAPLLNCIEWLENDEMPEVLTAKYLLKTGFIQIS